MSLCLDPCSGGFGSGAFGSMAFGSGAGAQVLEVVQESINAVLVTFSAPVKAFDVAALDDALYAPNYTLQATEPGQVIRLSQWVEEVVPSLTMRVLFDGPLTAPAIYRMVVNPRIEDLGGTPLAPGCDGCLFDTVPPQRLTAQERTDQRTDYNNPQVTRDSTQGPGPLGTYQITDTGDYALERNPAYLRKRVIRRATTVAGEFFHLPGYGFLEPIKGLIRADTLRRIQSRAIAQIRQEPDVVDVTVEASVSPTAPSMIMLKIRVADRYGRSQELTVPVQLGGTDGA